MKYPNVKVKLVGNNGNAFAVLGACRKAAKAKNVSEDEIKAFMDEAMSGDYDHLLQTCMKWFDVA